MHDTTIDADASEIRRAPHLFNVTAIAQRTGWSPASLMRGLWPAVQEFMDAHGDEWVLVRRYSHNNDLTVLARRQHAVEVCAALAGVSTQQ